MNHRTIGYDWRNPKPIATVSSRYQITPDMAWCSNCKRNGHPAYLCEAPARSANIPRPLMRSALQCKQLPEGGQE